MDITNKIENERKEKDLFFKKHPQSPIPPEDRNNFEGINYYPVKSELRFILKLHEHKDKKMTEVKDNLGNNQEFICWGEFAFEVDHKQITLQTYKRNSYEEGLWVPFRDKTNEKETYGAGRYIDLDERSKKSDKWILDFNQAYNPFCAYSEAYVCPFIPTENWIKIKIEAGEKKYHLKNEI